MTMETDVNKDDSYMICITSQSLNSDWNWVGNVATPNKTISKSDLIKDLKENGLVIVQFEFSSFIASYFFEVKGKYTGNIEYRILKCKASDYNWEN